MTRPIGIVERLRAAGDALSLEAAAYIEKLRREHADEIREIERDARDAARDYAAREDRENDEGRYR